MIYIDMALDFNFHYFTQLSYLYFYGHAALALYQFSNPDKVPDAEQAGRV
jgi:hypothetical protein